MLKYRTVWKYQPACHNRFVMLSLPRGSILRSAIPVNKELCVYAEVDPEEKALCTCQIIALGTGHTDAIDGFTFLDTVFYPECNEVYHVYYRFMPK